jgi:hypothetical protein
MRGGASRLPAMATATPSAISRLTAATVSRSSDSKVTAEIVLQSSAVGLDGMVRRSMSRFT